MLLVLHVRIFISKHVSARVHKRVHATYHRHMVTRFLSSHGFSHLSRIFGPIEDQDRA